MKKRTTLRPEFVRTVPEKLEDGVLYVSIDFATAAHRCCCGCGREVVTPLTPTDWKLIFDGVSVSLHPSVGNWSFPCQSHYWIERNGVKWAEQWSKEQIAANRAHDRSIKDRYFGTPSTPVGQNVPREQPGGFWGWVQRWFGS
jgi:Family of unknown function (DUF6527)